MYFKDILKRYKLTDKSDAEIVQFMHDQWGMVTAKTREELDRERQVEERILQLVDNAHDMTRSDVQAVAGAIAGDIA